MSHSSDGQTHAVRAVIESLDKEFARFHERALTLTQVIPFEIFYQDARLTKTGMSSCSIGEYLLRSAAVIEQTFGGITANLWDDPFEWTLPETLSTPQRVAEYLGEVEMTRQRAFRSFLRDSDLLKEISVPSEIRTLLSLLFETLVRTSDYQGRAIGLLTILSHERVTGFNM